MKSMKAFDPSQPAMLHDRVNNQLVEWLPDDMGNSLPEARHRS
jgi:hypothetical protein